MENLYSVKETAKKLGVSEHTVRYWKQNHQLQTVKIGKRVMIRESVLEQIINQGFGEAQEAGS